MKTKTGKGSKSTAEKLQLAAFMVAASRYTLIGGMIIGHNLVQSNAMNGWLGVGFSIFDIVSWFFLSVLEGYAIPYISRGMQKFGAGSSEHKRLFWYRVILLVAMPLLGAPMYAAISDNTTMREALPYGLYWIWAFIACGIPSLIIDAVGTVETVNEPEAGQQTDPMTTRQGREAHTGPVSLTQLAELYAGYYHEMTPDQFVGAFEAAQGKRLTTAEAEAALLAARAKMKPKAKVANGVNGTNGHAK